MTKEEYQRNLIRMFDSVRNNHKGEETCDGVSCSSCPFYEEVCSTKGIKGTLKGTLFHSYEAIEVVENWAKENPNKTNIEKFKEVFGFEPNVFADNEKHILCNGYRTIDEKFWDAEYKEQPKE